MPKHTGNVDTRRAVPAGNICFPSFAVRHILRVKHRTWHQVAEHGHDPLSAVVPSGIMELIVVPAPDGDALLRVVLHPLVARALLHTRKVGVPGNGLNDGGGDVLARATRDVVHHGGAHGEDGAVGQWGGRVYKNIRRMERTELHNEGQESAQEYEDHGEDIATR